MAGGICNGQEKKLYFFKNFYDHLKYDDQSLKHLLDYLEQKNAHELVLKHDLIGHAVLATGNSILQSYDSVTLKKTTHWIIREEHARITYQKINNHPILIKKIDALELIYNAEKASFTLKKTQELPGSGRSDWPTLEIDSLNHPANIYVFLQNNEVFKNVYNNIIYV